MNKRVRIYYMTQAQVAPPTFVLFTDRDIKMHFSFERFLANQIRESFGFIGSPIWFKIRARNKKESRGVSVAKGEPQKASSFFPKAENLLCICAPA